MPRLKAVMGSLWLWLAVVVIGGCATVEGLRQSAQVERLRAQQQQERADDIRVFAAKTQDALRVVVASLPADDTATRDLVGQIVEAQGLIIERSALIDQGARRSEEWQTADAECIGDPRQAVRPDTPEEDDARSDFQQAAHTAGKIRQAGEGMTNLLTGSLGITPPQNSRPGGGWSTALIGGLAMTFLGGGGAAVTLGRRALKTVTDNVTSISKHDQQRDQDASEVRSQLRNLTDAVEQQRQVLSESKPSSPPSPTVTPA